MFSELCKHLEEEGSESVRLIGNGEFESVSTLTEKMEVVSSGDHDFFIPKTCGFFVGNVLTFLKRPVPLQFDIVIVVISLDTQIEMDPPWPSKSTARAKIYNARRRTEETIDRVFDELPLHSLCKEGCFILVWLTNDPRCMERAMLPLCTAVIRREFFRKKGIVHVTTAFWVKTTQGGAPLVPLSCPSRETFDCVSPLSCSFERLLVGRYSGDAIGSEKRRRVDVDDAKEELLHRVYQLNGTNKGKSPVIAHHSCKPGAVPLVPFVVSTVSFHSRKPNCTEFSFL